MCAHLHRCNARAASPCHPSLSLPILNAMSTRPERNEHPPSVGGRVRVQGRALPCANEPFSILAHARLRPSPLHPPPPRSAVPHLISPMQGPAGELSACLGCGAALPFFVSPRPDALPNALQKIRNIKILGCAPQSVPAAPQSAAADDVSFGHLLKEDVSAGDAPVAPLNMRPPDAGKEYAPCTLALASRANTRYQAAAGCAEEQRSLHKCILPPR